MTAGQITLQFHDEFFSRATFLMPDKAVRGTFTGNVLSDFGAAAPLHEFRAASGFVTMRNHDRQISEFYLNDALVSEEPFFGGAIAYASVPHREHLVPVGRVSLIRD